MAEIVVSVLETTTLLTILGSPESAADPLLWPCRRLLEDEDIEVAKLEFLVRLPSSLVEETVCMPSACANSLWAPLPGMSAFGILVIDERLRTHSSCLTGRGLLHLSP